MLRSFCHRNMFIKKRLLAVCASILLASFISYIIIQFLFHSPTIQGHQGDGKLKDLSRRLGPFAIPGYSIQMPELDLEKPKNTEYHLTGLPNINRRCFVYFAISTDESNWQKKLHENIHARIQLEIHNSSGHVLVSLTGRLSDFTAYSSSSLNFVALYPNGSNSSFIADPQEEYIVRLVYTPDPNLKHFKGFIYVECGGHK